MDSHYEESYREDTIVRLFGVMQRLGDTTWQTDAIALLPQMVDRRDQLQMALGLASVDRYEGWPYVQAVIAGDDVNQIDRALGRIEKFDGKPNTTGGQPIDVAKQLHQLAATTPDNLTWPQSASSKQPIKDFMEAKAVDVERKRPH